MTARDAPQLRVDHNTGVITWASEGQDIKLPRGWRWAAAINSFRRGYVVTGERGAVFERHLAALADGGPGPQPPGGRYARFGEHGPCELLAVDLYSIEEPGFWLRFEAYGRNNRAAVDRLWCAAVDHLDTPHGRADFVHPVMTIGAAGRLYEHGVVRFIRFDVVDWLHADGARLLSKEPGA